MTILANRSAGTGIRPDEPWILASGGLATVAPAGTLPAITAALTLGFGLQLDVGGTADGTPLVCARTTATAPRLQDCAVDQWLATDAGSWFHPAFAGISPLPLAEALGCCRRAGAAPLVLRLLSESPGLVAVVGDLIAEAGVAARCRLCGPGAALAEPGLGRLRDAATPAEVLFAFPGPAVGHWLQFAPGRGLAAAMHAEGHEVWVAPGLRLSADACDALLRAEVTGVATRYPLELRWAWQKSGAGSGG